METFHRDQESLASSCWTVTRLCGRGKRLTGDYIKVCAAERADLEAWAARQGGVLDPGGTCHP